MFKELAPLLRQRPVVLLLNPLEGNSLRVLVMPKKLNDSEDAALATPVSVTGTPEELDEQLPSALTQFVGAHLDLKSTLEIAKEEMAAAAKAAKTKNSSKPGNAAGSAPKAADKKPANSPAKPADETKPVPAMTANLFNFDENPGHAEAPKPETTESVPAATVEPDEENEILSEIDEDERESTELDDAA
jgi:PRTRC genetic system protein E